jgi:hypothetical protein
MNYDVPFCARLAEPESTARVPGNKLSPASEFNDTSKAQPYYGLEPGSERREIFRACAANDRCDTRIPHFSSPQFVLFETLRRFVCCIETFAYH